MNAVAPGYIATDTLDAMSEDTLAKIEGQIPVGWLGNADEVARIVRFLVSGGGNVRHGLEGHHQWQGVHGIAPPEIERTSTWHSRTSCSAPRCGRPSARMAER
ncbi:SDR family oxidoreductase [Xanthobacter autotrophicus]|uniref:SDR family oxidoreductase n=1 Tax=Xanthobacter autotrophicus TaxID=280 RepID=UPI00372D265C